MVAPNQAPTIAAKDLVVVATYNERENLPELLSKVWFHCADVDVLVIDDNSPDGTGDLVQAQLESESRLRYIARPEKLGLGTAALESMRFAIANGYRYLINMDADFSHDPEYLNAIRNRMDDAACGSADIVIGSRYIPDGGTIGWPWYRKLSSRLLNGYARFWLGLPVRDCSGGYRCFRVSLLQKLDLELVRARGYAFHEEILWHLKRHRAKFAEVPILFTDRRYGRSKIRAIDAVIAVWRIGELGLCSKWQALTRGNKR